MPPLPYRPTAGWFRPLGCFKRLGAGKKSRRPAGRPAVAAPAGAADARYFPTVRVIFELALRTLPGLTLCLSTRPRSFFLAFFFLILPTLQKAFLILAFARDSFLPTTFGTLHFEKVAVTALSASSVTEHAPLPVHAPDQPANAEPESGTADSATVVPLHHWNAHVVPQAIPPGLELTVPEPIPALAMLSVRCTQLGNLKLPIRVRQLNEPVAA